MADPRDRDILIRTILGEAAGEDAYGQAAVGHVILNRTRDPRWGGSISDVALAPKQFSAWNKGAGGNNPEKWDPNSEAYKRTSRVVDALLAGQVEDMTGGATHYYSPAGMDLLVNQGHQSNTIPKWLQEENDRRGGQTYQHGGHIFTGKADVPALSVSTKGGVPALQEITMTTLDGKPTKGMMRDAWFNPSTGQWQEGGRPNIVAPMPATPENGFHPDWYFPASSVGGGGGQQTQLSPQGGPMLSEDPAQGPAPKFGQKGWLTPNRSEMLLSIGSGLLSGDDWSSGLGMAAQNLQGTIQGQREQEALLNERTLDREASLQGSSAAQMKKIPLGQVQLSDGSIRIDLLQDAVTGVITDSKGNVVDVNGAERRNNADVFGSRGQMTPKQAQEEQSWLTNTGSALTAFDRTIATVQDMKFGVEGFAQSMAAAARTFAGMGLTPEMIAKRVAAGDVEGLVGQSREQVVGPGVMTEQDAMRVIAFLGGDINSILSNPDVAYERLTIARGNMLKEYDQRASNYSAHLSAYPNLPYQPVQAYTPWKAPVGQGALDQSNAGSFDPTEIDAILKANGV